MNDVVKIAAKSSIEVCYHTTIFINKTVDINGFKYTVDAHIPIYLTKDDIEKMKSDKCLHLSFPASAYSVRTGDSLDVDLDLQLEIDSIDDEIGCIIVDMYS